MYKTIFFPHCTTQFKALFSNSKAGKPRKLYAKISSEFHYSNCPLILVQDFELSTKCKRCELSIGFFYAGYAMIINLNMKDIKTMPIRCLAGSLLFLFGFHF